MGKLSIFAVKLYNNFDSFALGCLLCLIFFRPGLEGSKFQLACDKFKVFEVFCKLKFDTAQYIDR